MLYKLIDGNLELPPREFIEDNKRIVGFTEDFLKERGYKPVRWTEPTSEEQLDHYTEDEDFIYQHWE